MRYIPKQGIFIDTGENQPRTAGMKLITLVLLVLCACLRGVAADQAVPNEIAMINELPKVDAAIAATQAKLAALMVRRGQLASNTTVRAATPTEVLALIKAERQALEAKLPLMEAQLESAMDRLSNAEQAHGSLDERDRRQSYSAIVETPRLAVAGVKNRITELKIQDANITFYLQSVKASEAARKQSK